MLREGAGLVEAEGGFDQGPVDQLEVLVDARGRIAIILHDENAFREARQRR